MTPEKKRVKKPNDFFFFEASLDVKLVEVYRAQASQSTDQNSIYLLIICYNFGSE